MTPILATLFDGNYLLKGLALIRSLQTHHAEFRLFVLALDDATQTSVNALGDERVVTVPLAMVETDDLRRVKKDRNTGEYAWTLTPFWTRMVLDSFAVPHVAYMDADSFLHAPLDVLYREVQSAGASIAIIPHRFPPRLQWRAKENGVYNVNWVYFKNDAIGIRALDDWSLQCLEWCYQRTEHARDGSLRFGDQGYLDDWQAKYGAYEVKHLGANLAPWSQEQYRYCYDNALYIIKHRSLSEPGVRAGVTEGTPIERIDRLLFYHFHEHGMSNFTGKRDTLKRGGYTLRDEVIKYCYEPYEFALVDIQKSLAHA